MKSFIDKMQSYTILYIEDDLEIRGYFSEFLQRYCKNIYECSNTKEALELYSIYNPDILLLDINLPGLSGIEFATLIREKNSQIRILMLTAYTDTEFMLKAVELDITRYLVKPVSGDELLKAFSKAIVEIEKDTNKKESVDLGNGYYYLVKEKYILKDNQIISLRKKEVELLEFLVKNINQVITYDRLENQIWQDSVMTQNSIRSQIKNLRQKTYHKIIKNISGIGYKFRHDTSS